MKISILKSKFVNKLNRIKKVPNIHLTQFKSFSPNLKADNFYLNGTSYFEKMRRILKFNKDGVLEGNHLKDRYVEISSRESRQDIDSESYKTFILGRYKMHWNGILMLKEPVSLSISQQLIYELKPKTIFEIGSFTGGSTLFLADYLSNMNIDCHIYSYDIDLNLLDEKVRNDKRITFKQGDFNKPEECFETELLKNAPHPWLVMEDAHVNLTQCLNRFASFMHVGDYFMVDDLNEWQCDHFMHPFNYKPEEYRKWGPEKRKEVLDCLKNDGNFKVDTYYSDMFGYNNSCCWDGILKKCK